MTLALLFPLFFAASARTLAGGHYEGPVYTYTGGVTDRDGNAIPFMTEDDGVTPDLYGSPTSGYGGLGYGAYQVMGINVDITATFTWTPAAATPDAPPPDKSYFLETGCAYADPILNGSSPSEMPEAHNGLGDEGVLYPDYEGPYIDYAYYSYGSHVREKSGPVITFTPSLSVTLNGDFFTGWGSIFYKVAQVPVGLTLLGPTTDSDGKDNILIGQGCTGIFAGGGGATLSNFQWSVDGETFANFEYGTTPDEYVIDFLYPGHSYGKVNYVDPAEWSKPSPHWVWKKGSESGDEKTVSVTADASVNGVSVGSVTVEKKVKVWNPSSALQNPDLGTVGVTDNELSPGFLVGLPEKGIGFSIAGKVTTPSFFSGGSVTGAWA